MQYTLRSLLVSIALGTFAALPPSGVSADQGVEAQIQDEGLPPILREGEAAFVRRPGDAEALLYEPAQPLAESEPKPEPAERPLEGGISISEVIGRGISEG